MTAVEVRPLAAGDRAAWDRLWGGYLDFYDHPLEAEVSDRTWQRLLGGAEGMAGIVAVEHGNPVGLAHVVEHASTWSVAPVTYLEDLFVAPSARGRGIGAALLAAVLARAGERGCDTVHWITAADNPARALYRRVAEETSWVRYEADPARSHPTA